MTVKEQVERHGPHGSDWLRIIFNDENINGVEPNTKRGSINQILSQVQRSYHITHTVTLSGEVSPTQHTHHTSPD